VLFYVLFVCKCLLYYWHRVSTQLQLTNISFNIIRDSSCPHKMYFANSKTFVEFTHQQMHL